MVSEVRKKKSGKDSQKKRRRSQKLRVVPYDKPSPIAELLEKVNEIALRSRQRKRWREGDSQP